MPWNECQLDSARGRTAALSILLLALLAIAQPAQRANPGRPADPMPEEKQLSVYGPRVSYSLPVAQHNGQDYVGLLEALEPLGNVSASVAGDRWKLRFNNLDAEFWQGATRAKVGGQRCGLPAPFVL